MGTLAEVVLLRPSGALHFNNKNVFLQKYLVKMFVRHCYLFVDRPEITLYPLNATEVEGYNVTLTCNAFGNPGPNVSWTVKGSHMGISNNPRISFSQDKKKMIITNLRRTDNGEYRCMATNSLGDATSHVATLDVQCKCSVS